MASAPKAPTPVDPTKIIQAQETANRVNRVTPFGSQTYGPDGSLTTTLPQGTQNAFNNITDMAGNKQQLIQPHQGLDQLQSALMNQVTGQHGGGAGKASPQSMPGLQANGKPSNDAWQAALSQVWGPH